MNVYDGERMAEMFAAQGMTPSRREADADLVVLNTCHIREKAAEKVYSEIGRLRREDGSRPMIAVAGCVAQAEGGEIAAARPKSISSSARRPITSCPIWSPPSRRGQSVVDLDLPGLDKVRRICPNAAKQNRRVSDRAGRLRQILHLLRGALHTRRGNQPKLLGDLIDEAKALVDAGAKEITLLGQNVNAWKATESTNWARYPCDRPNRGADRIRYMTSHPNDMTDGLIAAHGDVEKLMPFLHLPVQSGSDPILKAMNRSHSRDPIWASSSASAQSAPNRHFRATSSWAFPGEPMLISTTR